MRDQRDPKDPRWNPNHRERKPVGFRCTYQQIADAGGISLTTVKRAVSAGKLDPKDLASIVSFLSHRHGG